MLEVAVRGNIHNMKATDLCSFLKSLELKEGEKVKVIEKFDVETIDDLVDMDKILTN